MEIKWSMAEAKAKLSELLAYALEGHTVTITDEGEPLAEIRRLKPLPRNTEERIEELKRRGVIVPAKFDKSEIGPRQRVPEALARFLADRND